jgi:hypothetical protein
MDGMSDLELSLDVAHFITHYDSIKIQIEDKLPVNFLDWTVMIMLFEMHRREVRNV